MTNNTNKRKPGRPRGERTVIKRFLVTPEHADWLSELDNMSEWLGKIIDEKKQ